MKQKRVSKTNLLVYVFISSFLLSFMSCDRNNTKLPLLKVSANKHFLVDKNDNPFFWLGDTGWLLFRNLNRDEAEIYLEDRKQKGFNVIQVMLIHDINTMVNAYGDSALINKNLAALNITEGSDPTDEQQYDFWDHVDYTITLAEEKGLYMALVPIWGFNIRDGCATLDEAEVYATFLANRYKDQSNIIWLNGGDVLGTDSLNIWQTIGNTINEIDANHLMTFHPSGRTMSSDWFHNEEWLDFNMFQSGHRRYDQDDTERAYGQDNWRYVLEDYSKEPVKPTIDGGPSYEHVPHELHDTSQPRWTDDDARRYAYWSVFAGAFGHTYGHLSIMQFYTQGDTTASYDPQTVWQDALDAPGASQMQHLKTLMLSRSFLDRIPDQSLIAENQGNKYNHLVATRGNDYAFIYTYTGKNIKINMGKINGNKVLAWWFNPRNGEAQGIGVLKNKGVFELDAPGESADGHDWVLVLHTYEKSDYNTFDTNKK